MDATVGTTTAGAAATTTSKGKGRAATNGGGAAAAKKAGSASSTRYAGLPGISTLPAARVSKIIKADKEISKCSKEAIFLTSIATEHFIRRLADAAYTKARMDSRKAVTYKDVSQSCGPDHEFFFLEEVIPNPTTAADAIAKRKIRITSAGTPYVDSAARRAAREGSSSRYDEIFPSASSRADAGPPGSAMPAPSAVSSAAPSPVIPHHPTTITNQQRAAQQPSMSPSLPLPLVSSPAAHPGLAPQVGEVLPATAPSPTKAHSPQRDLTLPSLAEAIASAPAPLLDVVSADGRMDTD